MSIKLTTEEFINRSNLIHSNKYDYSETIYSGIKSDITASCPEHGLFKQNAGNHLQGSGCQKCANINGINKIKPTTEEFIVKAILVHGDKYDYSKVKYVNNHTDIIIICPIHGKFSITPKAHLNGIGCQKCSGSYMDTDYFIEKAKLVHGDKYDYSKVIYINNYTDVCIICPIHGEFWQNPSHHMNGCGCSKCYHEKKSGRLSNTEDFIIKANIKHNNKYTYEKVEYVRSREPIIITCPSHGDFEQTPFGHLQGYGCQQCSESKLEMNIREVLENNEINYVYEEHFKWLGKQTLDFYLPNYNVAIECQGVQHFKSIEYFGGIKKFEKTLEWDKNKFNLCKENDLKLFYFADEVANDYLDKIYVDKQELLDEILKHPIIQN